MKFTENRPIARAALALIVAGTLIIGGGNALIDQVQAESPQGAAAGTAGKARVQQPCVAQDGFIQMKFHRQCLAGQRNGRALA